MVTALRSALEADYVVIGGGNERLLKKLPPHARRGGNDNAMTGGRLLWQASGVPLRIAAVRKGARTAH